MESSSASAETLIPNLLSADSQLRSSSLRILHTIAVRQGQSKLTPSPAEVFAQCLTIERSEISARNVRERTTEIARLGRFLASLPSPKQTSREITQLAEAGTRYLLSQLKVNFSPLYAETIKALASLVTSQADLLWTLVWSQLEQTHTAKILRVPDLQQANPDWADLQAGSTATRDDSEESISCHNLDKAKRAMQEAWESDIDESLLASKEISVSTIHSCVFSKANADLRPVAAIDRDTRGSQL
jgi:U3 small nucleolar RNA-associated protein 20